MILHCHEIVLSDLDYLILTLLTFDEKTMQPDVSVISHDCDVAAGSEAAESQGEAASSEPEVCSLKAHRVIVAARCDWFRRALLSGMRESIDR